jgi:FkbM family methyltransferase
MNDLDKEFSAEPFARAAAEVAQFDPIKGTQIADIAHRLAQPPNDQNMLGMSLFCSSFLEAYKNLNYDMRSNGEQWLLSKLAAFRPEVVFDVGANVGDWLILARATLPDSQLHAFEIVESTFTALAERMAGTAGVVLNHCGLSDHSGSATMHLFDASSKLSSHVAYPHGPYQEAICPVKRGDEYVGEKGIKRIDLLKIDVEGAEHLVLKGFGALLDADDIDVIQFEYGMVNIITHFLLRDFYQLLEARGYLIGKLFPDHVDFRNYELTDEDFIGPNYVAVRKAQAAMIDALSSR